MLDEKVKNKKKLSPITFTSCEKKPCLTSLKLTQLRIKKHKDHQYPRKKFFKGLRNRDEKK